MQSPHPIDWNGDELIRDEFLGAEALAAHAEQLAANQPVSDRSVNLRLLRERLRSNEGTLLAGYRTIAKAAAEGRSITPAAEWLVDNYHLVEAQIREIRLDLPPGYYRQLPKLADGPLRGLPRVFGLAWHFVAHTDSRFEADLLCRFVNAYQRVQPLTIGELWAVAITLRIVLVENLRRAAHRIVIGRQQREDADALADRLLTSKDPSRAAIESLLKPYEKATMTATFAAQLVQSFSGLYEWCASWRTARSHPRSENV